jgi:hypothetical protein
MIYESKYSIGDKVLLESGRIETIASVHFEGNDEDGDYCEPKYHFERLWQSFRWESQIIKKM